MPKKIATAAKPRRLSPQERLDLDVEIGFLEGVVRRDPQYLEALQILGDDYTRRGRFDEGLKVDQQLTQIRPDDPMAHYNLACSYSLTEQCERAAASLDVAIEMGYRDFSHLRRDPDLKNLRAHPLYRKIRVRIREIIGRAE